VSDATLAGVGGDVQTNGPQGFDIINPADLATVQGNGTTPFDYLITAWTRPRLPRK
jgi:hypothetical protein